MMLCHIFLIRVILMMLQDDDDQQAQGHGERCLRSTSLVQDFCLVFSYSSIQLQRCVSATSYCDTIQGVLHAVFFFVVVFSFSLVFRVVQYYCCLFMRVRSTTVPALCSCRVQCKPKKKLGAEL